MVQSSGSGTLAQVRPSGNSPSKPMASPRRQSSETLAPDGLEPTRPELSCESFLRRYPQATLGLGARQRLGPGLDAGCTFLLRGLSLFPPASLTPEPLTFTR